MFSKLKLSDSEEWMKIVLAALQGGANSLEAMIAADDILKGRNERLETNN